DTARARWRGSHDAGARPQLRALRQRSLLPNWNAVGRPVQILSGHGRHLLPALPALHRTQPASCQDGRRSRALPMVEPSRQHFAARRHIAHATSRLACTWAGGDGPPPRLAGIGDGNRRHCRNRRDPPTPATPAPLRPGSIPQGHRGATGENCGAKEDWTAEEATSASHGCVRKPTLTPVLQPERREAWLRILDEAVPPDQLAE